MALPVRARAGEPVAPGLTIVSRAEWGPHLPPTGPVPDEPDVRFLLVHHSADRNDYSEAESIQLLETIYGLHTSADRGWPDIAYNFLVDRFGVVYEGRTGSMVAAKAADATGGSQGFAQLCCFLGDHRSEAPSDAARQSMVALLGWLAGRFAIDLSPGATTTFTSRGSNLHPTGAEVTTPTVAGHRDMSRTACPGDAAYASVADGTFARLAAEHLTPPPATTAPPPPPPTETSAAPPTETSAAPTAPAAPSTSTTTAIALAPAAGDPGRGTRLPSAIAAGVAVVGAAAALAVAMRRRTGR